MSGRIAVCFGLLSAAVLSGCVQHHYEIEMSVEEGRLHRRLLGGGSESAAGQLPRAERERLTAEYGHPVGRTEDGRSVVAGMFEDLLPQDVGGAGYFRHWTTSMGSLTYYAERFRGSDDVAAMLHDRLRAVDQLVDLLAEWVQQEATDPVLGEQIRAALQDEIRRDVKNLTLLVWTFAATAGDQSAESTEQELGVRCVLYLVEHGYTTPDEIPQLLNGGQQAVDVAKDALARKCGLEHGEQLVEILPSLADEHAMETSVDRLLAESDRYAEIAEELREREGSDEMPSPADVIGGLIFQAIGFDLSGFDKLKVRFQAPRAPFATNGTWSEEGHITWSTDLETEGNPPRHILPPLLFAAWSEPDAAFQQQHFGRTVLDGESLGDYVFWRQGLTDSQAAQWDELLTGLKPDDDLAARLDAFRFSEEREAATEDQTSLADKPRALIKAGMSEE